MGLADAFSIVLNSFICMLLILSEHHTGPVEMRQKSYLIDSFCCPRERQEKSVPLLFPPPPGPCVCGTEM